MHISELYKQIYKRFDHLTPVPFDCGAMCGKLCCEGDEESGMYLFPGEEKLFAGKDNFSVLPTDVYYGEKNVKLLVCHGPCKREERPLSCRIFPLIFRCKPGENVNIIHDPRATMCPLTHPEAAGCITTEFKKEVSYALKVLSAIPAVRTFMETITEVILEEYCL